MKLTCPQCQTELQLDPVVVPEQGMAVSCYQCLHTFELSLPGGMQGQAQVSSSVAGPDERAQPQLDSLNEIDFSALAPPAQQGASLPPELDVGAALFSDGDGFGFELPEGSSSTFAAIPPPGAEPAPQAAAPTPSSSLAEPASVTSPERPVRPSRPNRAELRGGVDLPQPTSRRAPPKAFNSPQLTAGGSAPRMEAVFVEEAPAPSASEELFAVQSPAPQGEELFAVQSPAPQGEELFAVQSPAPQGEELFAVQSPAPQGDELFAVQSPAPQGEELFAVQSPAPQGEELFAVQPGASQGQELFAVQSGGDAGLEALFNSSSSSSALGLSSAPGEELDIFSRGADALFELDAPAAPVAPGPPPPPLAPPQAAPVPAAFTSPQAQPTPLSPQMITPVTEGAEELEDLSPVSELDEVETQAPPPPEQGPQVAVAPPASPSGRSISPLLIGALILVVGLGGLHFAQPTLLPGLLSGDDEPTPPTRRVPNLRSVQTNQRAPEAVALPTSGPAAPKPGPGQRSQAPTATAQPERVNPSSPAPLASAESPQPTAQAAQGWHELPRSLRARLSNRNASALKELELASDSPLSSEGFRGSIPAEATAEERAAALAQGALYFSQEPRWSREASEALKALDQARPNPTLTRLELSNALSQGLSLSEEHAIAYGLKHLDDARAQELLGHAYLSRSQSAAALEAFKRSLKLDPAQPLVQLQCAELSLEHGELDEAERGFEALRASGHEHAAVRRGLAKLELKRQKTKEAFTWIDALFEQPEGRYSPQEQARDLVTLAQVLDLDQEQALAAGETRGDETLIEREQARSQALQNAVKSWPDHLPALSMLIEPMRRAQQEREALKQLSKLTKEVGENPVNAAINAQLLLDVDREAKALETLQAAVQANPQDPRAHEALVRELMRRKEFASAREAFEGLAELSPNQAAADLLYSELLIKEARVDEAQESLEASIKRRPWSPELRRGLADLKLKIGLRNGQKRLIRESYEGYDRVLTLHPGDHQARLQRARAAIKLGRAQEALEDLTRIMGEPTHRGQLDFELGEAKMALKRDREARAHFEAVLKRDRGNLEALRAMGQLYERAGDHAQAKRSLEQALAVNTRDPNTRYELGRLSLKTKDNEEAINHLRIAAEAKLQDPEVQYWFGRALERSDERPVASEARAVYENAARLIQELKSVPKQLCDVHFRVGKIHAQNASELSRALDDFAKASDCDPSRADIWSELGRQYERLGDQKQALAYYRDALKRDKAYPPALIGVALSHLRAQPPKRAQAQRLLERVAKRSPQLAEPHYHLCKLHQFKSRKKAQRACSAYLKRAPSGEFAGEVREILKSL